MSPPVVLIVRCGIVGPVLGNFNKRKGYHPIVLNLVGLADLVKAESSVLDALCEATPTGEILGTSNLPSTWAEKYHQPATGIRRTILNLMLKQMLLDKDVEVCEGWELVDIEENDDSVTAIFNGGRSVTGSFLIGCDGIKAASRRALLQKQGCRRACRLSALRNWYGDGVHVISYPITPTQTSWAVTQKEKQEKEETWRPYRPDEMLEQRDQLRSLLGGWDPAVLQLVDTSERIIKFGIFDRPDLKPSQWFSKRCVLVGDAAHPTSPHPGQGANQALEDCFHLSHSMPFLDPNRPDYPEDLAKLGASLSETIFSPYAEMRQPRTALLVRGARAQGASRVGAGFDACEARNAAIRSNYKDPSVIAAKFDGLLREPFQSL
ncbi:monooxygenase FAD-binding protein [Coniochaeta sp. 2T2.1]|nr:monooxygenase FAD-binding protein [Coniochaeta sp. 2T2.1]